MKLKVNWNDDTTQYLIILVEMCNNKQNIYFLRFIYVSCQDGIWPIFFVFWQQYQKLEYYISTIYNSFVYNYVEIISQVLIIWHKNDIANVIFQNNGIKALQYLKKIED